MQEIFLSFWEKYLFPNEEEKPTSTAEFVFLEVPFRLFFPARILLIEF